MSNLGSAARACNATSLDHMLAVVSQLLDQSPAQYEVTQYVESSAARVPHSFTPEEYRSVLLDTLAELVSLAAVATEDEPTALLVESPQRRPQSLASRLSDLVRVSAVGGQSASRAHGQPGSVDQ